MLINRIKLIAMVLVLAPMLALVVFHSNSVSANRVAADDAAAIYKAKCAMCHSPAAAKFFDAAKPEEEMVQAVLKGKKAEKPPNMPGFEDKGINEEAAKGLVTYMKSLKTAAN